MREKLSSLGSALLTGLGAVVGAAPTWTTAGGLSLLSLLGPAGGAAAGVAGWLVPLLIALSILLLGRAFYVLYVRRRGTRVSAAITWASAIFVAGYWTWRML